MYIFDILNQVCSKNLKKNMGRIVYREKSLVTVVDVILVSVSYLHVIHFFKTINKTYYLGLIYLNI